MSEDDKLGRKFDGEKPRYELMTPEYEEGIVKVLTLGSEKYADHNWKFVKGGRGRYYNALRRHLAAWKKGEKDDPETGLNHLYHASCC